MVVAGTYDPYLVALSIVVAALASYTALDLGGRVAAARGLGRRVTEHVKDNPGTRPPLWWRFEAPRLPMGTFQGWWIDGKLPEPRKRTGGTGTAAYEVTSVGPSFDYGIPDCWVGINQDDPPVFESQAAYLKRNGLLFAGEERRADFEPEMVSASNFL